MGNEEVVRISEEEILDVVSASSPTPGLPETKGHDGGRGAADEDTTSNLQPLGSWCVAHVEGCPRAWLLKKTPAKDRGPKKYIVRFQFGLRKLFLLNFLAACALSCIQMVTTCRPPSEVLSPCIWPLGALSVIVMAVLGDAVGREWGALVGSSAGVGIWGMMLAILHFEDSQMPLYLPVHLVAMVVTPAAIIVPAFRRMRSTNSLDDELPTVSRLLLCRQQRGNRVRRW